MLRQSGDLTITMLDNVPVFADRLEQLRFSCGLASHAGAFMEFGVFEGGAINHLANNFPSRSFTGFDSFTGLPKDWVRSNESIYPKGYFSLEKLPSVAKNVTLVSVFFRQSLQPWLEHNQVEVSFVHIDCDLYSSAADVLLYITPYLRDAAIIVFDELCDWSDSGVYPNWPEGEWRALCEWSNAESLIIEPISRDRLFSATIRVCKV
ncbi:hypothetical protein SAMN06295933_3027 [Desulfovibrio gilichinskyi]|uniref:Macrocin-O-methyltransferase (TylF) n=2 Tax=Desulfovibrio gilichinskyi TaxID=1519643 RepID=A0A1X7EJM9_9BACT|nr:hypothetical protein SAMN06295933_3027 [Desulfovibrio gilichinskyi]